MRLKHGQHPSATSGSRGFQCSANFRGMMRVIVHEQKTFALILDLKPTPRVLEFTKRSCNFFKWNSKLRSECDHAKGIVHVVFAGNVQGCLAEYLAAPTNAKKRAEVPDRKSTRLNSSHTVISYAVFCLKKKKKKKKKQTNKTDQHRGITE